MEQDRVNTNTILVIDNNGNNLGQRTLQEAERIADEQYGLDLVEVRPGVYKILDLGRLNYEASKRKQVKSKPIKEMKFKLNIGAADYGTKINHVQRFLNDGHTVHITVWFTGREVSRPDSGVSLMERIVDSVGDFGSVTMDKTLHGRNMNMSIAPGTKKS